MRRPRKAPRKRGVNPAKASVHLGKPATKPAPKPARASKKSVYEGLRDGIEAVNLRQEQYIKNAGGIGESLHKQTLYMEDQHKLLTALQATQSRLAKQDEQAFDILSRLGKHQEDMLRATVDLRNVVRTHHGFLEQIEGSLQALLAEVRSRSLLNYPTGLTGGGNAHAVATMTPAERFDKLESDMAEVRARMKVGWK